MGISVPSLTVNIRWRKGPAQPVQTTVVFSKAKGDETFLLVVYNFLQTFLPPIQKKKKTTFVITRVSSSSLCGPWIKWWYVIRHRVTWGVEKISASDREIRKCPDPIKLCAASLCVPVHIKVKTSPVTNLSRGRPQNRSIKAGRCAREQPRPALYTHAADEKRAPSSLFFRGRPLSMKMMMP